MAWEKNRLRMETAVRLTIMNLGMTDAEIAEQIGISPAGYAQMKAHPEFKLLMTSALTGMVNKLDIEVEDHIKNMRNKLESAVPIALENLVYFALRRDQNPKLAIECSKEILNREGHFAAVSRIGLPTEQQGGFVNKADQSVADALAQALIAGKKQADVEDKPVTDVVQ